MKRIGEWVAVLLLVVLGVIIGNEATGYIDEWWYCSNHPNAQYCPR